MSKYISKYASLIGREFIWHFHVFGPDRSYVVDLPAKIVEIKNNYVVCDTFPEGSPPQRRRIYMAEFLHEVDDEELKAVILSPAPKPTPKHEHVPYGIYKLTDPRNEVVRYVGMSRHIERRYQEHIACSGLNLQKNIWIVSLHRERLLPRLDIIETIIGSQPARERETYWIRYYLEQGAPLTNILPETFDQGTRIDNPDFEAVIYGSITGGVSHEQI